MENESWGSDCILLEGGGEYSAHWGFLQKILIQARPLAYYCLLYPDVVSVLVCLSLGKFIFLFNLAYCLGGPNV